MVFGSARSREAAVMNIKIIPYVELNAEETPFEGKMLAGVSSLHVFHDIPAYKVEDVKDENLDLVCEVALAHAEGEPSVVIPGSFAFYDGDKFLFADSYFSFSKVWLTEIEKARRGEAISHALSNEEVYDLTVKGGMVCLKRRCGRMPDLEIDLKSFEQELREAYSQYENFKSRFMARIMEFNPKWNKNK